MAVVLKKRARPRPTVPIAPMIDVVFLLLIYFMVSATLQRQEADISFGLPGMVEQADPLDLPDEQIIEVRADGEIVVNEFSYGQATSERLNDLIVMLTRFRQTGEANRSEASVTIAPEDSVPHQWVVRVMDACAAAGIDAIAFAAED
jgi:biopolymer transport protein ExbD